MPRLTQEERRRQTIHKLLDAALAEFAEVGFSGASIERITERAGYSRGAFYAYFKTKHDLLLAVLQVQNERETALWRELIAQVGNEADAVELTSRHFAELAQHSPWGAFALEVQLQAMRDAAFAQRYRDAMRVVMAQIRELIELSFRKAGRVVPADLDDLALGYYTMASGLMVNLNHAGPEFSAQRAGAVMARFQRALQAAAAAVPPDTQGAAP